MKTNANKTLKVVNKEEQKKLSVPMPKAKAPKVTTPKAPKIELHKALIECNASDKAEIYSLSGALNRLKKQIKTNATYKKVPPALIDKALTFDNVLLNVSERCIKSQKFSLYAVGLALNKQLKVSLK